MLILFISLITGNIKLSSVKEIGNFFINIMPLLFVPATVGFIESWDKMKNFLTAIIVISLINTVAVAAVSGRITQYIIKYKEKKK